MADDLIAFLAARLDEDERAARTENLPPRALSEVKAKRAILPEHQITDRVISPGYQRRGDPFGCENCHDWDGATEGRGYCGTLLALAAVYADHPDYRQEWNTSQWQRSTSQLIRSFLPK
jgi:hypothetical protein